MRIWLKTTPSTEIVPFNYQSFLVGALHKWLGDNDLHDEMSLYSLSWFDGGEKKGNGLYFPEGAGFFISCPDPTLHQRVVSGVFKDPEIRFGLRVVEITMVTQPVFSERERFVLQSPVLIKRTVGKEMKFFFPQDPEADDLLTETLMHKLRKSGRENLSVRAAFDKEYSNVKTKLVQYKGIKNKATFCPVIVEGDPEAIAFAWDVGIGNSTGIGFGAVR